ncbi:hypothetical protein GCM10016234_33840 [Tianweitania populi]|uniref:Uncharacterized protein n=2 Tax=Tianweitania populi TaxID=1607949 RepID=A0A8J3E046_9HYPH|nr:hypothetical protein GCM10016234_33840 [Tianweitania populi]
MNGMMNMMPMMNPMMMGMNPMMSGMMPTMMCRMTMEMTDQGMVCKMMPMDGMSNEMFNECCKRMAECMNGGMPMMMACGGMMMMCMKG